MNKIEFVERIVMAILDREHKHEMADPMDDSEYIPLLRRIIVSASERLVEEGFTKDEGDGLADKLYNHARKLYVESWMSHIEEDEDVELKEELIAANKTFNEHYEVAGDFQ